MRVLIIMLAMILITVSGSAADEDAVKATKPVPETAEIDKQSAPKTVSEKQPLQWPRPYKATEEISVDNAVPFPADI